MPNFDNLMQEWPEKMEDLLESVAVPGPDLECDFSTYVTILCSKYNYPIH